MSQKAQTKRSVKKGGSNRKPPKQLTDQIDHVGGESSSCNPWPEAEVTPIEALDSAGMDTAEPKSGTEANLHEVGQLPETNLRIRYAEYRHRLLATTLDIVVAFFILTPLVVQARQTVPVRNAVLEEGMTSQQMLAELIQSGHLQRLIVDNLVFAFGFVLLSLVSWMLLESTPGKMLVGLRVVRSRDGEVPGFWQWGVRALGYFISGLPLLIGFFWVVGNRRRRGWHDYLAATVVVVDHRPERWVVARLFVYLRQRVVPWLKKLRNIG